MIRNTITSLLILLAALQLGCNQSHPQEHDKDWFEYKLAQMNEPLLDCFRGRSVRLILEGGLGQSTFILGVRDLGDEYVLYRKKIDRLTSTIESKAVLMSDKKFNKLWRYANELNQNLISNEQQKSSGRAYNDGIFWTIELSSNQGSDYRIKEGEMVPEQAEMLQFFYDLTPFQYPIQPLLNN